MAARLLRRDVLVGAAATVAASAASVARGAAAAPETHEVAIRSFKFEPKHIAVKVGDTIVWTNEDIAPHTATASQGGWDTGEIVKGDSRSVVVVKGMETNYICAFHPQMKGTIETI